MSPANFFPSLRREDDDDVEVSDEEQLAIMAELVSAFGGTNLRSA